jgi:ClpP class serine protease
MDPISVDMSTNSQVQNAARQKRRALIGDIEKIRNSKVLVYFCGDRAGFEASIAPDSVRWIYDHLLSLNNGQNVDQIDLYLYSIGGALEAPWQIISTIRQFCKKLNILIPYKAYSAATLVAIGADKILMGRKGELGPIDPQMIAQSTATRRQEG